QPPDPVPRLDRRGHRAVIDDLQLGAVDAAEGRGDDDVARRREPDTGRRADPDGRVAQPLAPGEELPRLEGTEGPVDQPLRLVRALARAVEPRDRHDDATVAAL